ncbi:uncharacterized protein C8R40DRAFT_1168633 [Lentinula edodes]|uniref:uncharacterized protein n=1 Tax=Lentinula edodes TaxID=5353 RepID=UPI001E8E0964|nr:uncharacterized protein C8R40DRAFT_1168633 [Lentinula edodes]KAH7877291.1 hypothetical protein C8R40DRAFT_1168633 [Lentinula edodes]
MPKRFATRKLWDLDLSNVKATPHVELRIASPLTPPTLKDVHPQAQSPGTYPPWHIPSWELTPSRPIYIYNLFGPILTFYLGTSLDLLGTPSRVTISSFQPLLACYNINLHIPKPTLRPILTQVLHLCIGTQNCYIYDSSLNAVTTIKTPKYTWDGTIVIDPMSVTTLGVLFSFLKLVIDSLVNKVHIKDNIAWIEESIKDMGQAGAFPDVNIVLQKWTAVQQEFAVLIAGCVGEGETCRGGEEKTCHGGPYREGERPAMGKVLNKPS